MDEQEQDEAEVPRIGDPSAQAAVVVALGAAPAAALAGWVPGVGILAGVVPLIGLLLAFRLCQAGGRWHRLAALCVTVAGGSVVLWSIQTVAVVLVQSWMPLGVTR